MFGRVKIISYLYIVSFPLIQKGYSHTYLIILYVYVFFKQNNGWFPFNQFIMSTNYSIQDNIISGDNVKSVLESSIRLLIDKVVPVITEDGTYEQEILLDKSIQILDTLYMELYPNEVSPTTGIIISK